MNQVIIFFLLVFCVCTASGKGGDFPGSTWETRRPEEVGLSRDKLDGLRELVGGRGCVVRHGYMVYSWGEQSKSSDVASAFKPVLSTLLLMAVQEGRLKGADDCVAEFEPRLKTINDGKDGGITWRHLASQTSGYGLAEPPGAAYSYNDFALTLYYELLTQKVFKTNGTEVLRTHLAEPLQFEDGFTFNALRRPDRDGRLALSVRDFARIGLLYLHNGQWRDRQLVQPEFIHLAIKSPIPASTPLTSGREADMLPGQHSIGGGKNITRVGPGYYSFNWWLNRTNQGGQRLYVDAPADTYVASGHGGKRTLWIIPSLDLIVSWNDSPIDDHDASPGNPNTKCNQAARLMVQAVRSSAFRRSGAQTPARAAEPPEGGTTNAPPALHPVLGVEGSRFTLNGKPVFLYGMSYYGALAAKDDFIQRDLGDMQQLGINTSVSDLKELREVVRRLDPRLLVTASHAGDLAGGTARVFARGRRGLHFAASPARRRFSFPDRIEDPAIFCLVARTRTHRSRSLSGTVSARLRKMESPSRGLRSRPARRHCRWRRRLVFSQWRPPRRTRWPAAPFVRFA